METYLLLRKRYIRIADLVITAWASPESVILHMAGVVAWLVWGAVYGSSDAWQFALNQPMTVESDILGLMILASVLRSGKIADAKADTLLRDLKDVDSTLVGLQNRPEDDVPTIAVQ